MRFSGILVIMWLAFVFAPNIGMAAAPLYTGENVLVCANYNDGITSSDITLIVQLEADGKLLIDEGHPVKFIVPQADIPNFEKPDFDDSGWQDGKSGVGYGDNDDNTEVPAGNVAVIYTRYRFKVSDATAVKSLILRADYDDDYVAWLNGVEIARSPGMATGGSKPGEIPPWDYGAPGGKVSNHEASKTDPPTYQHEVVVEFQPVSAVTPVSPASKLATTWGSIKGSL